MQQHSPTQAWSSVGGSGTARTRMSKNRMFKKSLHSQLPLIVETLVGQRHAALQNYHRITSPIYPPAKQQHCYLPIPRTMFTVSVLGREEGHIVKYTPLPEGVPESETRFMVLFSCLINVLLTNLDGKFCPFFKCLLSFKAHTLHLKLNKV